MIPRQAVGYPVENEIKMANYFKRYERKIFIFILLLIIIAFAMIFIIDGNKERWIGSVGLLLVLLGIVQLEISGLFDKLINEYSNEEKYPYGPPSYITREIIDDPDRPFRTKIRNICFFNIRTGFWFVTIGTIIQIISLWI